MAGISKMFDSVRVPLTPTLLELSYFEKTEI